MSSRRSRRGGTRTSITLRRYSRSSRKRPAAHVRVQIAVGRGDDAHVRAPRLRLADALELLVLQEAQELGLQAAARSRDLVEEEGAAVRGLHLARLVLDRAREGAARVAEQLAGQQLLREGRAWTTTNGPAARGLLAWRRRARTPLPVPFSPRSRTAASEPGGPAHRVEGGLERGRARGQLQLGHGVRELAFEVAHLAHERAPLGRALDQVADLGGRERLGQVVDGAAAHRLHRGVDGGVGGDDDDVEARAGRRPAWG